MAKPKTIYRTASRQNPYAQIVRTMLQDENLSLEAAGALSFILSLPETWEFDLAWLCKRRRVGRDKATRILKELIARGYCKKDRDRDDKGRLEAVVYQFSDDPKALDPLTEKPSVDTQDVVDPLTENPALAEPALGQPVLDNPHHREKTLSQSKKTNTKKEKGASAFASLGTDPSGSGPSLFSQSVIDELVALDVDVEALIDRYETRTKSQHIADPSAYLLQMGRDEVAKRTGVTADQVKNSCSKNRLTRCQAAADATRAFSVPSAAAIETAHRRRSKFIPECLALIAKRRFPSQEACDRAFEGELTNAHFRHPCKSVVADLFADQPQQKDHAA